MTRNHIVSGRYQKQDFKRTLAICPRCKEYMGAMRADCYAAGLKKCKALPIKYCFKCDLIMVLDRGIPIVYQIHTTQKEAKQVIKDKKFKFRSRTKAKILNKMNN